LTEIATAQAPAAPAEPDISPVPDIGGHFVVGAVGVAEEGGTGEAPGVAYGGRFAPEALTAALDELTAAYEQARKDPAFRAELDGLLRNYAGRPTLLYRAERFGQQAGGCTVLLKREDLAHTGSHKINNVLGQVLLAQRKGKTRVIA
jgi:tryptophan synthase beta subunit